MKLINNSLYIVSTPIGNLEDITLRAINVLKKSDIILCEDTRRSLKLLTHYKINKKLISYHKFNEKKQTQKIIEYINRGKILSLISDAGTPLLSDPGRFLIKECVKKNINIVPIPGVSSITASMSVSGFDDKFLFYGFLPKTVNQVEKTLKTLSVLKYTQIFFIPALKVNFYLKKFKKFYYNRQIMIAKEITKMHEIFYREDINNIKIFKKQIKGELTVIVSETNKNNKFIDEKKITQIARDYLEKYSLKDTVELLTINENLSKKKIYQLCLKLKNEISN